MAHIKDILEIEKQRDSIEEARVIHLFQEGTFYRAYEWSAWLMVRFISEKLKVTNKPLKNTGITFVFVGFPVTSLQKYSSERILFETIEEKHARMTLPADSFSESDTSDILNEQFQSWKQGLPPIEVPYSDDELPKNGSAANTVKFSKSTSTIHLTDIMRQVLSYPIEQHSPLDCVTFLSEIKKQLSEMI